MICEGESVFYNFEYLHFDHSSTALNFSPNICNKCGEKLQDLYHTKVPPICFIIILKYFNQIIHLIKFDGKKMRKI